MIVAAGNRVASLPLTRWAANEFDFGPEEIGYMSAVGLVAQISECGIAYLVSSAAVCVPSNMAPLLFSCFTVSINHP